MWVIIAITVLIGFVLLRYKSDLKKQRLDILQSGGMKNKYKVLIDLLSEGDNRTQIFRQDNDSIVFGLVVTGGFTKFELVQTFGTLSVKYLTNSNIYGKHSISWEFNEGMNQEKMVEVMNLDIYKLNQKIIK